MSTTATRQSQRARSVTRTTNATRNWQHKDDNPPTYSITVCACPDEDCPAVEDGHVLCWICEGAGCTAAKAECK